MTENKVPVDTEGFRCPVCDAESDAFTSLNREDGVAPGVGDVAFCFNCGSALHFRVAGMEPISHDELMELRADRRFARAEILSKLIASSISSVDGRGHAQVRREEPDEDGSVHEHVTTAIELSVDGDTGEVSWPEGFDPGELPEALVSMVGEAIRSIHVDTIANQIKEFVTPEVASNILVVYGKDNDEVLSVPSPTTMALISLIRLAHEMDDEMIVDLDTVRSFHGYILGIHFLAEGKHSDPERAEEGWDILRRIAGILPPDENADRAHAAAMKEAVHFVRTRLGEDIHE